MLVLIVDVVDAQGVINNLKQAEDESSQLMALTDLCELLSISTEDTMTVFPVEQVVPLLVSIACTSL
jgi:E3 ubiquitin-protein ligase TRIP12